MPRLAGKYVFGDLSCCGTGNFDGSERLFWIDPYDQLNQVKDTSEIDIHEFLIGLDDRYLGFSIYEFGLDSEHELYVVGKNRLNFGYVVKIVPIPTPTALIAFIFFAASFSVYLRRRLH